MLSEKETQQQFSKNHGGSGRERFQRLISKQLEKGARLERGLLLCLAVPLCHAQARTRRFLGVWVPNEVGGKTPLPLWGSDVSFLQALRLPRVGTGGSRVASRFKPTFKFASTSAVVALKLWVCAGCGDRGHCQPRVAAACPFFLRCEAAPHPPHPALTALLPSPSHPRKSAVALSFSLGEAGQSLGQGRL